MHSYQINHVLSTGLLRSVIFDEIVRRLADCAPPDFSVTLTNRPERAARIHHFHRPNLERRLPRGSVVTVHHDPEENDPWLRLSTFLPRYREAERVHCLNSRQQKILGERGIAHTVVIPHGVDRDVLPVPIRARQPVDGQLRLGFVSRRHPCEVKGEGLLARLLEHLDPARVSFLLVGEGRWREAALARAAGFRAQSYDRLPYRLFGQVYERIDALLVLSQFEGGPACVPEALGSGIPVISTRVGMCIDVVSDGRNGILLARRPKDDGERIMALLDDQSAGLAALMDGAFAGAGRVPSWEEVLHRYFDLYREIPPPAG